MEPKKGNFMNDPVESDKLKEAEKKPEPRGHAEDVGTGAPSRKNPPPQSPPPGNS